MDGMLGGMDREAWPQPALPAKALHPAFLALAARTRIVPGQSGSAQDAPWVVCPQPGDLVVAPGIAGLPEGEAVLRFGLEFAWLCGVPGLAQDAALLLAARAAGGFRRSLPSSQRVHGGAAASLLAVLDDLAHDLPAPGDLLRLVDILHDTGIAGERGPAHSEVEHGRFLEQTGRLWSLAESCEMLLVSGGDDRLRLDLRTGLNRYGCAPWPLSHQIAFASSTASCISEAGQRAAEALRQRLVAEALSGGASSCIAHHTEATAASIVEHFGVSGLATAVLTASGTDAALVVTRLLQAEHPGTAMTSILMSPAETGSGVPEAVCARHFADRAASGEPVRKGAALDEALTAPDLLTIALRDANGCPRNRDHVAGDCARAIEAATARGRAVLHAIDGSKSGLAAPDRDNCVELATRFGDRLDIVIDACQARIEPALIRFYLDHGFPVLVTGSKFFGAPGFCGAVLFPIARLRRIVRNGRISPELDAYADLADGVLQRRCPGLLLRWAAALNDMQMFGRLPASEVRQAIERFAHTVRAQIMVAPRLSLHAAPRPTGLGWSGRRSVFTFALHGPGGALSTARLRPLYLALAAGERGPACLIGQPVEVGAGSLRVALSASQIASGEDQKHRLEAVFDGLQSLLASETT